MNVHISPDHTTETILNAALRYAAGGWPVFPCKPSDKRPLTPNGFKDASTNTDQIRDWWTKHPNAMIGMATGKRSGVLVLDLDIDPERGLDGIAAAAELGELPDSLVVRTPRGGLHCYLDWQEGLGNSRGALPAGIDVRGEGGYVILPPSRRADGVSYTWAKPPGQCQPAEAPAWLLAQIRSKPAKPESSPTSLRNTEVHQGRWEYAQAALERECAAVANAAEGSRNETLNRATFALGQLVAGGALDEQVMRNRLRAAADACGLDQQEAERTIASGLAAGAKEPRGVPEAKRHRPDYPKPSQDDVLIRRTASPGSARRRVV
jgi:putative DNA primase/helicase